METTKLQDSGIKRLGLTQSQLMMWMGQKLSPDSPMYNMALAFDLSAAIDIPVFRLAFQNLIRQCDAMRTTFTEVDGEPWQLIPSDFPYEVTLLDFSQKTDKERELDHWLKTKSQRIFDITECLFESVLIKMESDRYVWFFNQHHLITDAWAMTLQYRTVAAEYARLLAGEKTESPALPPFEDYLHFEAVQRQHHQNREAKDYWSQKASRLPSPPDIYGQANRQMDSRSERLTVLLSKEKSDALRALTTATDLRAWTQHLSLFNIFSTLVFSYLHRITGQQKIAIGTPAHNRTTTALKQTPGLFIELFPLLVKMEADETFTSLFQKVRNESHEFLRHAQTGTSSSDLSRGFNVVLNYINASFSDFNGIPMQSEWIHSAHADPGHHIRLQVHDFDASGCIELCFDLNVAVFTPSQRAATPQHFLQLLDAFIADRFQEIGKPALAIAQPIGAIPEQNFHFESDRTVLDLIENQVLKSPQNEAVRDGTQVMSYAELETHANRLARYLLNNGVVKGDRIAILLQRSTEFVISVLATLKAGAVFIPIPVNYPSGRILGILEDAQTKIVLSNSVFSAALPLSLPHLICLDKEETFINQLPALRPTPSVAAGPDDLAYLMYTSGSTGLPKGVMIGHRSLSHYSQWARHHYSGASLPIMPLFTSVGFDLTITSLFLPLVAGGTLVAYAEAEQGPDLSLLEVLNDNRVNLIKLTPSHLMLLQGKEFRHTSIESMIVGGENFKTDQAEFVQQNFKDGIRIFNEYGPTEATVGCMVYPYNSQKDRAEISVPIGLPIPNTSMYVLDEFRHPVPEGVVGELYIGGVGLAKGYWQQEALTAAQFISNPFEENSQLYRSGDLVRQNPKGYLEYLGRKDLQVKIRGRRVELAEIETVLNKHPEGIQGVVELRQRRHKVNTEDIHNCVQCGLPSNYPSVSFDEKGLCNLCQSFTGYQEKVHQYFKTQDDLQALFDKLRPEEKGEYDCLALLSGGKDSTYALAQLVEMNLKVLAFTLDNGYISDGAKDNITRVVTELGVDHVFGETEAMNAIFVDSLERHCNVCDGCFKTIYTLSIQLARQKNIPFIVTGLSRGQFFETRLTEELFRSEAADLEKIDQIILDARKAYHQVDDAVKELLDVSMFEDEQLFEKVRFIDYYRYSDVSLDEMLAYLDTRLPWVRPSDTGRSTNCLINKAGIYVHKKERGYSNYAFPYSWDVRVGHKTRDASLEEINEEIPEAEVKKILEEIGYTEAREADQKNEQLVAYYVGTPTLSETQLKNYLLGFFPEFMVPVQFIRLESLPLTVNGKINRAALPEPDTIRRVLEMEYVEPQTELETIVRDIWSTVMQIDKIGIYDNFIDIGGDSLSGIRVMARINETLELDLPVNLIFQQPTIARLAAQIEDTMMRLLQELDNSNSDVR